MEASRVPRLAAEGRDMPRITGLAVLAFFVGVRGMNGQEPPLLNFSGYRNFMGTLQLANDIDDAVRVKVDQVIGSWLRRSHECTVFKTVAFVRSATLPERESSDADGEDGQARGPAGEGRGR